MFNIFAAIRRNSGGSPSWPDMRTKWKKRISALLFAKSEKIPWRRERIRAKGAFRPKDNLLKTYKFRGPPELIQQWAEEARQKQLDQFGRPRSKYERQVCRMLANIGIHFVWQHKIFIPGSYMLADQFIPSHRLRVEEDGPEHDPLYDRTRDAYLYRLHGIRTIRFSNNDVERRPAWVEAEIRKALGL